MRDGQAELTGVALLNIKLVYLHTITHLYANPARRRVTSLVHPTMLPVRQTATKPDPACQMHFGAF